MENVVDSKDFRNEVLYYKFTGAGEELFTNQLERIFTILYRPNKEMKRHCYQNEEVEIYNNKAMLYDYHDLYKYILNGSKLFTTETLKKITEPSENTVINIFHHNDLDGDAAGAIVNLFVSNPYFNNTVYYTSYAYTVDSITPACENVKRKRVNGKYCIAFVVDISLSEEQYREILNNFDEVIWIDHHQLAIKMLEYKKFNMGRSQIIIDTRYSATYLCYNLLKGYLKKYCNVAIKDTFPTLVSIEDTKPYNVGYSSDMYLPIVLTQALKQKIIDKGIPYKRTASSGLINPSDSYYESSLNTLKTVYIRNALDYERESVKYNKCKFFGMYLNSYYRNMGSMGCYSNIYETLMTNDEELFKVLEIGRKFKELEFNKNKLINDSEVLYTASFNGSIIVGNTSTSIPANPELNEMIKLNIRRINSTKFKVNASTNNRKVKFIGLNKIFKDLYGDNAQGGHKGVSSVILSRKDICNFYFDIDNGYSYKMKNFNSIYETNKKIKIEISGNELRKDDVVEKVFRMISVGLFAYIADNDTKRIEKIING